MKRAWACLFLAAALAGHAANLPLSDGEELVYNVAWVVLPGAGRITVDAHAATGSDGRPVLEVLTKTETRSLAHLLLPFEAWAKSVYDRDSGRLIRFEEQSKMRDKVSKHTMTFDYARHLIVNVDPERAGPETYPFPPDDDPIDLINCVMEARRWHLHPGQTRDVFVFFERDFYPLTIHAVEYEDVNTPGFSSARALLLEPRMDKTPPKGMFKRGGSVKVWLGDWEGHTIPLRFQVQFKFGSGIASLSDYHPGAAAPDPASSPGSAGQN
ncbi:MAG TPA: DUF3108 domain-containing protein [Opitutaceae bacterium]|jgi:hypothetical protein